MRPSPAPAPTFPGRAFTRGDAEGFGPPAGAGTSLPWQLVRAREERDRRNLTPDQLALVMGRHYNRRKQGAHSGRKNDDHPGEQTCEVLAKDYGVGSKTVWSNGKFAAAVETLKAVDPEIEAR